MYKYEDECKTDCGADGGCRGDAPGEAGEELEGGEEVGEGGVGEVVCVFCLFMVVYRSEDFLGCDD